MRALIAAALAVLIALAAVAPHDHTGPGGAHACAVCVAGSSDVARSETPDVAPAVTWERCTPEPPAASPVCGAPLGAVPGQSPPSRA